MWKQLFQATWKTHKSRYSSIISNIGRHRNLVDSQASIAQIEAFQESRKVDDARFYAEIEAEDMNRFREVYKWLKPANVETDQYQYLKLRADYPGTGRWLLDNQNFKDWFSPQFPTIPPLLWLNGMPGAGKNTIPVYFMNQRC